MFEVKGRVHYEPKRKFRDSGRNQWWMTLEIPDFEEIGRYYRWFIDREWYNHDRIKTFKVEYHRPSHPYHVSIIRGEKPRKNIGDWGDFLNKKKFTIQYDYPKQIINPPNGKGFFWVCEVKFKEYNMIREHFGLDTAKDGRIFTGHLTMARSFVN